MTLRICIKVLLALVICFIVGFEGNSAFHIPRSDELAEEEYNAEYREPSEEYSIDEEQNFRMARRTQGLYLSPFGQILSDGECHQVTNHQYKVSECHNGKLSSRPLCILNQFRYCVEINLFREGGCEDRENPFHTHKGHERTMIRHVDEANSFKILYNGGCPSSSAQVLQDITGPGPVSQMRNSAQGPSLENSDDSTVDSETPIRWFKVKLQEYKRRGNLLTKA